MNKIKWNNETFKKYIYEKYDNIILIGDYKKYNTTIETKCKKCDSIWFPTPANLIHGKTHCPFCSRNTKLNSRTISHEEFIKKMHKINPNIEILGKYTIRKKRIQCKCKKCGHIWEPLGGSLLQGYGCLKCARKIVGSKKKKTEIQFIEEMHKINPSIEIHGGYNGAYTPVKCECKKCGHIWNAIPHYILMGSGCPICAHTATSFIEQFILRSFQRVLGKDNVISRDKKAIGKELDIYLPKYNLAIEPGAWNFHKSRVKKDFLKRELCEQKNIRLITIYYGCNEYFDVEDILVFQSNFSRENDFNELVMLVYVLFKKIGIIEKFSNETLEEIKNDAYLSSRKISTKEFIEMIRKISPNIQILGEYKSSSERIECKCDICNNVWSTTPNMLLQGRGCPLCARVKSAAKRSITQEQFLDRLKIQSPNIVPLEKYINSKTKISFKCNECSYVWKTTPGSIFSGSGCPNCAKRPLITTDFFKNRMLKINPSIEILGQYINTSTKLQCRCLICSNEWYATPNSLSSGYGCPACANERKGKRKSNKDFLKDLNIINPNLKPLEEYKGNKIKIKTLCLKCGYKWDVKPNNLLSGSGCPRCAKKRN